MNLTIINRTIILFVLSILLSSCFSSKKLQYFTEYQKGKQKFITSESHPLLIRPNSQLYISITSFDEYDITVLNGADNNIRITSPETLQLVGYTVDQNGFINYPLIGKVNVNEMSLQEAGKMIEDKLAGYLNSPSVSVRFINKSITVLGEVNNPGRISYTKDQINIFQAIGMAGDLTSAGNRKKVIVLRNYPYGLVKEVINLKKEDLLLSDYYYLQPNDIVYISPTYSTRFREATSTYSLVLSTITTALLIFNYVN